MYGRSRPRYIRFDVIFRHCYESNITKQYYEIYKRVVGSVKISFLFYRNIESFANDFSNLKI